MISFLVSRFINQDEKDINTKRYAICKLLGYVGIALNVFLFAAKFTIGHLVGSVAIKGDAINNLTDSMSNIVSIFSFRMAEKPADKEHPYGHGRTETIAALFMGMVIVYLGIDMLRQSVEKILNPSPVHFEWAAVIVLVLSILTKFYMYRYNHRYGVAYQSDLLEANAIDSRNDMMGTSLVLISTLLSPLLHYDLDGIVGVVVSGIIFYSAWGLLKEVISSLLGQAPDAKVIGRIEEILKSSPMVLDVHDIAVHTYGPKYTYATAHVEVDGTLDLMDVHSEVDRLERIVAKDMNIELVTHVDPVLLNDETTQHLEMRTKSIIKQIDPQWNLQDFRLEQDPDEKHLHIFFDLVVPFEETRDKEEIEKEILKRYHHPERYYLEMRIVHPYL